MTRLKTLLLILALALLSIFPFSALADQQSFLLPLCETSSMDNLWLSEGYTLLVNGDTFHALKVHYSVPLPTEEEPNPPRDVVGAECYVVNQQGEVVPCQDQCGEMFTRAELSFHGWDLLRNVVVTPWNETYLIDMSGKVFRWTPSNDTVWKAVTELNLSGLRLTDTEFERFRFVGDESALYLAVVTAQETYEIYMFDWISGEKRLITSLDKIDTMTCAGEGKLLVQGRTKTYGNSRYYILDSQTGELSDFIIGLANPALPRLVWDRQAGWYYAWQGGIQYLGMDKQETTIAGFSGPFPYTLAISEDKMRFYVLTDTYDYASVIVVDQQPDSTVLTISGRINDLNPSSGAVASLTATAPELDGLQLALHDDLGNAYDVAQFFMTQGDTCDILALNTAEIDLRNLFTKSYFIALDDQPAIQAFFDELYPVWQDACTWQGSIAAFPLYVDDQYQFMYNTELWSELELDVPTSYHELFLLIREMDNNGLLDEYPLFELNGRDTRSFDHLLYKLLGDYILHCDTSGASISFIDPVLEQLLQELSELRNLLDRHDNLHLTGNPLMAFSGSVTSVNYVSLFYEQYGQYAPMLLSLDETREPVLQSHITVLLVNPYSKNIELAKAWLSWLAANPTDRTRCVLITGMPDGIETERSRIIFAEYEEREAVLQQKYNEALASGDPDVIEEAQDALYSNIMPMHNWNVTPEHARMLYPTLPFAHVIHYNPYTILLTNGEQVIQEYLYGKRTAHELLQALQSLAVMINAEGS